MYHAHSDISLTRAASELTAIQKLGTGISWTGIFLLILSLFDQNLPDSLLWVALTTIPAGVILFAISAYRGRSYGRRNIGILFRSMTSRGSLAWGTAVLLTVFYITLYWFPRFLGMNSEGANSGLVDFFDPLSSMISGAPATQWFVYGTLYTLAILAFGVKFLFKYRRNKYETLRTLSVMFFQLGFAFLIPELLMRLNQPYFNPTVIWPLNYDLFSEYRLEDFFSAGNIGMFMLLFGIASIFVITPVLTFFYGKRWYCSWVCGCGGLAETAGDPYRHLSDKSLKAWRLERWMIHTVLVLVIIMTIAVVSSYLDENTGMFWLSKEMFLAGTAVLFILLYALIIIFRGKQIARDARRAAVGFLMILLAILALYWFSGITYGYLLRQWYGFLIGAAFSGVIGVGFYPIFGNRVWCRFGCPMAAILGMQQRLFSRFRITTNGGQCISCGNCSTYCEMGIDVRSYAQKGENIVRSSCVGCGICSDVCPRGVLKLENGPLKGRINSDAVLLGNNIDLLEHLRQEKIRTRNEAISPFKNT